MDIFQKIRALDLPEDTYVIVGGSTLVALGLIAWDEDIDICVAPNIFEAFKAHGWQQEEWAGKTVLKRDIYDLGIGFGMWSLEDLQADAILINSIPFINPKKLLIWKQQMKRPKDLPHIKLIKEYMKKL